MDVSVIIVNYNTTQLVIDCINTIYNYTKDINFEIIVVDNNSLDRSIKQLNDIFPEVKLILNDKNSGFGAANNLGNKFATGKYLLFLNSDTLFISNAISDFFQFMERTPDAGVCGGNLLTKSLQPTTSFEREKPSLYNSFDKLFFKAYQRIKYRKNRIYLYKDKPTKIEGYVSGADYFVRRNLFNKVKGFDEDFFMYYEEVELSHRINMLKFDTYVIPYVKIIHLEGCSQNKNQKRKIGWMLHSLNLYYIKTSMKGAKVAIFLEKINLYFIIKLIEKLKYNKRFM